ncbi:MAG: ABC transporter permease [Clostridia bacterium]|jgi:simple sugar transport system permease protein|nr:ABC transporter permease [Clostridia bacterium]MDD3094101.1 ABC transporter permease [Clostridia bacterium]NLF37523.1 ABC transporter permease [Clostridiaceae bacterium]
MKNNTSLSEFFDNFRRKKGTANFISSLIAIGIGLVIGIVILLVSNPAESFAGFFTMLVGGFNDGTRSLGNVFYFATPIIMTGLAVGFAFKTGLFNIGASGQFIVGAYVAVLVGVKLPVLGGFQWVVGILAAMIAGAIWGAIPGILKAFLNVHEVISSIMMNYIGMFLVNYLIKQTVLNVYTNRSLPVAATANIPKMGLTTIFPGSSINGGFLVAVLFVVLIYIVLEKTTFGYELKACGYNRYAAKYAGINETRSIVLSMAIAGMLAGIGGALFYLSGAGVYIEVVDVLAAQGFTGISVALLGMSSPIGILFSGIFIAWLQIGGFYMQRYSFVPEFIQIITAIIIYSSAASLIIRNYLEMKKLKKDEKRNQSGITETVIDSLRNNKGGKS